MFSNEKIRKANNAEPNDFERQVAQELFNVELSATELKADLHDLYISSAKEVALQGGRRAIILVVPFPLLRRFQLIHTRLVSELEKKFQNAHVLIIGQRTIYGECYKRSGNTKPIPTSRTLSHVQDAILEDVVYPTQIVGRRTRYRVDGTQQVKITLSTDMQEDIQTKLDTFSQVYGALTSKDVVFEFPVEA